MPYNNVAKTTNRPKTLFPKASTSDEKIIRIVVPIKPVIKPIILFLVAFCL